MGCVSPKLTNKNPQNKIKYEISQPTLYQQQQNHITISSTVIPQYACGYNFNIISDSDNKRQNISHDHIKILGTEYTTQSNNTQPIQEIANTIQKCKYYYNQHDIDTAYQYVATIQQIIQKYKNHKNIQIYKQLINIYNINNVLIEQIKQQYNDVIMYEHEINKGGWIEKSNKNNVKISTRRQSDTVGVLVQSVIDQSFQVLITVLIEMGLYKQFMPFMTVSRQQKIAARNCRIGYTQNKFPFFSVREAFFQGVGYNRLHKNKRLFLFTRSIHNRPDLQQKLGYFCSINPQFVQLQYKYFVLQYQPICKGKGKIILAMNVDTKFDFIPMWILDKISQDFGNDFLNNIMKMSKKWKGSQWQKNTQANPAIFLFFKNAIDKYLSQNMQINKKENKDKNMAWASRQTNDRSI